ncbi:MAG: hypothetical protein IT487_15035 [Chromatiaceae bacterium]|nr:hypothetical protein [Chromatiaceae bacterium]
MTKKAFPHYRTAPRPASLAAALLAAGLVLAVTPADARSLLGRIWDRYVLEGAGKTTKAASEADLPVTGRWPQHNDTVNGQKVRFDNPHVKGRLGDRLTALRLTGMGYTKLKSKYNDLHGIDGVYVKKNAQGEITEIRLVESKVDTSRLNPGPPAQMSDEWIRRACQKMLDEGDAETASTARLILEHMDSPLLKRELWHHDLTTGKSHVRPVDGAGKAGKVQEAWQDQLVAKELTRQCLQALLVCE